MNNKITISQEPMNEELKTFIKEGFRDHALETVGQDGAIEQFVFVVRFEGSPIGALVARTFWGGFHLQVLYLAPEYRGAGLGTFLVEEAFNKGKALGCRFAFVETMSFQAVEFYKSLGFVEEFSRSGYDGGHSFHYLKRDLG